MGGRALHILWALLLVGLCWCGDDHLNDRSVVVVGNGECADCAQQNIQSSDAFSGLYVAIDCKATTRHFETKGFGKLDKEGKFYVELPNELVNIDGELKEECFAQLRSASHDPCPAKNGLEPAKIVLKSKDNGKHTFGTIGKLSFTPATCTSEFLWPFFKHPPLPKVPWFKPLPKFPFPHFSFPPKILHPLPPKVFPPIYKKPFPPKGFPPIYKKPLPPPIPIYKPPPKVMVPPTPVFKKPLPPPTPVFKKPKPPPIPIYKPPPKVMVPPTPVLKKPLPPPTPVFKKPKPKPKKPCPPTFKKPSPPIPKSPPYTKPLPPKPKVPPTYKKSLPPPIPKFPPVYKKPLPPKPKLPPTYKKPLPPPIPKFPPVYKKPLPPKPKLPPTYKKPLPPPIPKFPPTYQKPLPPPIPNVWGYSRTHRNPSQTLHLGLSHRLVHLGKAQPQSPPTRPGTPASALASVSILASSTRCSHLGLGQRVLKALPPQPVHSPRSRQTHLDNLPGLQPSQGCPRPQLSTSAAHPDLGHSSRAS